MISESYSSKELSSAELRSKIFDKFKSKGVLDTVKTQLRNHLALELNNGLNDKKFAGGKQSTDGSLFLQLSNDLVVEHLKCCSYDYSLSVFLSESFTSPEKHLSVADILQLLQIRKGSKLYAKLIQLQEKNEDIKSFLWTFLLYIAEAHGFTKKDCTVQTDPLNFIHSRSLGEKLVEVEKLQLQKHHQDLQNDAKSIESKMLMYQRKYEAQKQAELQAQMERFQKNELANMRIEEREKYAEEINQIKNKYREESQRKIKELNQLEDQIREKAQRQEKLLESDAYEKRQKILNEMQMLKDREREMKETHNKAMRLLEIEEEKLKNRKDQLRFQEQSLKELENRYQEKLEAEIVKVKYELQKENKDQIDTLNERELHLREEIVSFQAQKELILKSKTESENIKQHNQKLQISLLTLQQELKNMKVHHQDLEEQQGKFSDYEEIRQQNIVLKKELQFTRREIDDIIAQRTQREKEHQRLVKDLVNKISSKRGVEKDVKQIEVSNQRKLESDMQEKFVLLQNKYELEVTKNNELRKMYNDLLQSEKEMVREIDQLRMALMKANQEKEKLILRNRENKIFRSIGTGFRSAPHEFPQNQQHSGWNSRYKYESLSNYSGKKHDVETDLAGKEETFSTIKKLEAEAEEFEKSYRDFLERQNTRKSPSHVHFDAFVQKHSPESLTEVSSLPATTLPDTLHLSRLIPDQSIVSFQRLPNEFNLLSKGSTVTSFSSKTEVEENCASSKQLLYSTQADAKHRLLSHHLLSQPLSSTQAASAVDAPSFGFSRVTNSEPDLKDPEIQSCHKDIQQKENDGSDPRNRNSEPTDKKSTKETELQLKQVTTSAYRVEQKFETPLVSGDSLTQYPLLDSKTLTQYPLLDSNLKTPLPREVTTPATKKLETLTEHITLTPEHDDSTAKPLQQEEKERTNSVEAEYNLNEASIGTFESPGLMTNRPVEVFSQPSNYQNNGKQETNEVKSIEPTFVSIGSQGNGSKFEPYEKEEGNSKLCEETNTRSSQTNKGEMNAEEFNNSLSEGEVAEDDAANDIMANYMQMVMQKREQDATTGAADNEKVHYMDNMPPYVDDDIPLSEADSLRKDSEKSSEYEW